MNLASIIEPHPADAVAVISRGRPCTYGQLRDQVGALRGALVQLGVGRGDRVALVCENVRYFVDVYLATLGIGAVAVPLNPTNPAAALTREIATVGAKVVFVGPSARTTWAAVDRTHVPTVELVIGTDGQAVGDALVFEQLLATPAVPIVDVVDTDLAALMFTSGTVGAPVAAQLTHGNLLANLHQSQHGLDPIVATDVIYGVLPLHHIFGLNVVLDIALLVGACVVLVQRFDPSTALETIAERKCTIVVGAPPMWVAWSHFAQADRAAFATVRMALSGAAKLPEAAAREFADAFGLQIREGYGLTEASPVVTASAGIEPRLGSIGQVLPGIEVRLVDPMGDDVIDGDAGEIWVRGPNVFGGYWNDPTGTAKALTADGWLRTGDIAVMDDDGYLFIVDRAKDLIIVSGFNVYPAEVEDALLEHPGVAEAAVVGVAHPHTGEAVKAYVVAELGTELYEEELIEFCLDRLARYKCPTKVLVVPELPKGLGGKLLRRVLR